MLSNVRPLHHPARTELHLSAVLFALSDPTRLHIVRALSRGSERRCGDLEVPLAKSSCSRHFKVLREAGVIHMRREGTAFFNALRRTDLDARFPGLLAAVLRSAE